MKKALLFAAILTAVMFVSSVSAIVPTTCTETTIVGGTIYEGDISNGVSGADVDVTCTHNGADTTISGITSGSNGEYSVAFDCGSCAYGDEVSVSATKDSKNGEEDGSITMTYGFCGLTLNVGIVNVPLIPEFGLVIGTLTALCAVGIFFFVRK